LSTTACRKSGHEKAFKQAELHGPMGRFFLTTPTCSAKETDVMLYFTGMTSAPTPNQQHRIKIQTQ